MEATVGTGAVVRAEALSRAVPGLAGAGENGATRYGQRVSGAELAAEFLQLVGATAVFGIPGGASLPLCDALTAAHHAGAFRFILTGHEQGAGFEALGFAAASGRCGFCTATSGPGATNLVTPLADATRDSRPVFALTGNTATTAEREAFQAIDIVGITDGKATKASFRAAGVDQLQAMLVEAYHLAVTGRPGAVLVDMPKDVQAGTTVMQPWEPLLERHAWSPAVASEAEVETLAALLTAAERPLIYAGHGLILAGGVAALRRLCAHQDLPVATTLHALGALAAGDPRNLGMLGMHGPMVANIAPYLADLVLVLGGRFDDRVVGAQPRQFAPHARVVQVDIEPLQLQRVRPVDLAIHGDVGDLLERLVNHLQRYPQRTRTAWREQLAAIRAAMPTQSYDRQDEESLTHEWVYGTAAGLLADLGVRDVVAAFDVGTHQMKGAQWFPAQAPRSWITSGGMGSMGCALPMAVGARMARPSAAVLAFCGDGGFVMSSHELDTIGGYGLPLAIIVFDDSALGMVGTWHSLYFADRTLSSDRRRGRTAAPVDAKALRERLIADLAQAQSADDLAAVVAAAAGALAEGEWPLFSATAAGYGIPGERVHDKRQCAAALRRALSTGGPYLVQVMLPGRHGVFPLMEPGTTPQEMVWRESAPGSGIRVHGHARFDYQARALRDETGAPGEAVLLES